MNNIKITLFLGFCFVAVLGTLWHFIYDWTGQYMIIGFIAPINESIFEHMKLIFFPGLLFLPIATYFLKVNYPCIRNALSYGILLGTVFIPVFYYTYSGILGRNYMWLDIASFYIAAALVFITTYILLKNKAVINPVGYYLLYLFLAIFLCFTYRNNGVGIFEKPII